MILNCGNLGVNRRNYSFADMCPALKLRRKPPGAHRDRSVTFRIARILRGRYRDFAHHNKRNPLRELIFIVCSVQTQEASYRRTYRAMMAAFATATSLQTASVRMIERLLAPGGLGAIKARQLRAVFDAIASRFGSLTLAPLKRMADNECESFLTSLPGIGLKVARCIMLYSLGRQVFPVDTHCWRIARRLGWVRATQEDRSRCAGADMDRLQAKIPPALRFSLHVNFVSLGREFCLPLSPRCESGCPLRRCCPRKLGA